MSSDPLTVPQASRAAAIRVESVGKCYRIYKNPQDRFRQALFDQLGGWWRTGRRHPLYREHWALRDISFELGAGEAVGVVGRNGAGKSTLLQIIAGTLDVTEGQVQTSGRITALLELGSGFNLEFTGRENVFLNAQILGLSREAAGQRFDEIAGFADIGDFIDQPLKTYSSGMVMRLAFAVQTVLEPDILIVDEALSVGDAKFQAKCFRKIRSLRDRGAAILFVSHDVNSIISFCDRALLLEGGKLLDTGSPQHIARRYIECLYGDTTSEDGQAITEEAPAPDVVEQSVATLLSQRKADAAGSPTPFVFGNGKVQILAVAVTDDAGRPTEMLNSGETYRITQRVIANEDVFDLHSGIIIRSRHGIELFGCSNKTTGVVIPEMKAGQVVDISMTLQMWLAAGDYYLQVANAGPDGVQYDCRIDAVQFTVIGTPQLYTTSVVNLRPEVSVRAVAPQPAPAGTAGSQQVIDSRHWHSQQRPSP
jgi:lipopolysaccharide transport system ATP-binding protein